MATKKRPKGRKAKAIMITVSCKHESAAKVAVPMNEALQEGSTGYDIQDLLTSNFISSGIQSGQNNLHMQDILYNSTPAMRQLGYKSGFSTGKDICQKSGNGTNVLFGVLEKAGMGKVLYYPFEDEFVIKSTEGNKGNVVLNGNMHAYQCGMIAGYLSAYTGREISTVETECVYNSANACKFRSRPGAYGDNVGGKLGLESIIDSISKGVGSAGGVVQQDYYLLSLLPLTDEPLLGEVSKILYLSGGRLAKGTEKRKAIKVLKQMARYFDMEDVRLEGRGDEKVMTLKYKQYNSMSQFIELSTSMFAGFAASLYDSRFYMEAKAKNDKCYTVRLALKANNK